MAQSMAAEQLAGQQAASTGAATTKTSEMQEDAVKLSDKAVSQVSESNPGAMNRRTQLRDSVLDKLNREILDPSSEFNQQKSKKAEQGGGKKKKKKVKQKREWEPKAEAGQIHEGREVIGKIRVTEEAQDNGGDGNTVSAAGKAGASKGATQAGTTSGDGKSGTVAATGKSQPGNTKSDNKDQDKESKEIASAQNMEKSGLQVQGMNPDGKLEKNQEPKGVEEVGAGGKTKEYDVKGQATGVSQTLTMKPAKELQPEDKSLGTFRRLDDKPMLKYVTLESKNSQAGEQELIKKAKAAGESPDAIQRAVEKLRDRTQP